MAGHAIWKVDDEGFMEELLVLIAFVPVAGYEEVEEGVNFEHFMGGPSIASDMCLWDEGRGVL